jgi:hypothetical protein
MFSHTTANMGGNGTDEQKAGLFFILGTGNIKESRMAKGEAQCRQKGIGKDSFVKKKLLGRIACNTITTTTPPQLLHFKKSSRAFIPMKELYYIFHSHFPSPISHPIPPCSQVQKSAPAHHTPTLHHSSPHKALPCSHPYSWMHPCMALEGGSHRRRCCCCWGTRFRDSRRRGIRLRGSRRSRLRRRDSWGRTFFCGLLVVLVG